MRFSSIPVIAAAPAGALTVVTRLQLADASPDLPLLLSMYI